jgi:hypothetical protein
MKNIFSPICTLALVLSLVLSTTAMLKAQSNETNQVGLRLGGFSGFQFKHINDNNLGFELNLLGNRPSDWGLFSGEIEKHFPIGQGFVLFVGGGAYVASRSEYFRDEPLIVTTTQAGFEGVAGIDFYIPNTPLNLGFDIRPRFGYLIYAYPWDAGVTLRYVFH